MISDIKILTILLFATMSSCGQSDTSDKDLAKNKVIALSPQKEKQKEIINEHLKNGAWKHELFSRE
ncbi:hypothetical protein [Winogradskyella sp. SM1960]|uniref:hypothetical protein n=1 Tax=Winogradskyella sp. SM1960 TaxID=2865955 RepID=UPI001CD696A5|nr:hypothetical protein [Winogradskyella sp. SM1960]